MLCPSNFTFHVEAESSNNEYVLSLLVSPDTDFEDCFKAWDIDANAFVRLNGWLWSVTSYEFADA